MANERFESIFLFSTICSEKSKRRTKTVMNSCQPQWNQSFIYSNVRPSELRSRVLEVTVWDYSRFGSNEFLGEIGIDLHGVNGNGTSGLVEEEPVWHFLNTTAAAAAAQAANAAAAAALEPVRHTNNTHNAAVKILLPTFLQFSTAFRAFRHLFNASIIRHKYSHFTQMLQ